MNSSVIPSIRYADAPAAIEWLCKAFGFQKNVVHPNPDGTIAHAQLTVGGGMVMLGSGEKGSTEAQGIYIVVPDCDAVYAMAKAADAEITRDIRDMEYGGRGFTCKDPEGHQWSVGSYDPWKP
jgi:uncharacterized glyoxalase superfamily protein PhnB